MRLVTDWSREWFYKDIASDEACFQQAMHEYSRTLGAKSTSQINLNEKHTMEEVLQLIDSEASKYREKEKGFGGKLRKLFRKLGEHNKTATAWIGVVPAQSNYMSIVCSGLKFIIEV